jgi:hypothetical protein
MKQLFFAIISLGFAAQAVAADEKYVLCTHGLRSLDGAELQAFMAPSIFRLSDLKFKAQDGWRYEINCASPTCLASEKQHSVLLSSATPDYHESYHIRFDAPNMEIITDRMRLGHTRKRTSYVEFQCDWIDESDITD